MRVSTFHRPSPALVIALIALFVSLGGTGYAASRIAASHSRSAGAQASKALTKRQINALIAGYFKAHQAGLVGQTGSAGTAGAPGAAGAPGTQGPQGPGALPIVASTTSATAGAQPAGTAGPWSFTLTCGGGGATFTIHGPGTVGGTTSLASGVGAATTYVGTSGSIGSGANSSIGSGGQMSQTEFLQSGSTLYEVKMLMTAVNGGLFNNCTLVGDAIPVS
jgi:pilus assembly protein FimV